jgi:purine-binding chemotaxis protein CheW
MNDALSKEQWISFHINGATYVQPIEQVREIVPYREPAPVPGAPAEVEAL